MVSSKTKTLILAAMAGLIVSLGVGYALGTGIIGPKIEESRPAEVYGTVSVTRWNKPAPVFTAMSTEGEFTFPVKGKVNVITPQYVRCPDICQFESQMMVYVMEKLVAEGRATDVVFITIGVDPWDEDLNMARIYQEKVAGDLLDKVEWVWVLDSVGKMQEIYDAYDIYVEKTDTGLVNHFGGFFIVDRQGTIKYIVHPDWDRIYDSAKVLHEKILEVLEEG